MPTGKNRTVTAPRRPTYAGTGRSRVVPSPRLPVSWQVGVATALIVVALVWWLWPSSLGNIKNLSSSGTTLVAFGDSLTAGYGAAAGEDYPAYLSGLTKATIVNAGVSGDTTEGALARVDRDVLVHNPRIVIVGLGGNDFLRGVPIATTEVTLRAVVRQIQGAGAMVVLLGFRFPTLRGGNYEAMYEKIAEEEGCVLVPDLLDGILADPALKSDSIHPNGRGYQLMAERVSGPLQRLIAAANEKR